MLESRFEQIEADHRERQTRRAKPPSHERLCLRTSDLPAVLCRLTGSVALSDRCFHQGAQRSGRHGCGSPCFDGFHIALRSCTKYRSGSHAFTLFAYCFREWVFRRAGRVVVSNNELVALVVPESTSPHVQLEPLPLACGLHARNRLGFLPLTLRQRQHQPGRCQGASLSDAHAHRSVGVLGRAYRTALACIQQPSKFRSSRVGGDGPCGSLGEELNR